MPRAAKVPRTPADEALPRITPTTESVESEPDPKACEAEPSFPRKPVSEITTSESLDKLAPAFVKFRAICPNVGKDKEGYNYRYTTLAHIIDKIREPLQKYGLAVTQFPVNDGRSLGVVTTLLHESGQFIQSRFVMPIPVLKGTNATQDAGAAISYARRYALSAVLCMASDDDTDAVYSSEAAEPAPRRR